jgi:thiamine-monophosphate kinase
VVVTGRLGWSAAGLALLSAGATPIAPLLEAHRRPSPPYALGPALADLGATAMCDVSDGLLADLSHIARASGVHVDVESRRFPRDHLLGKAARATGGHPLDFAMTGGEDHALVATLPAGTALPPGVVRIGKVTAGAPGVRVIGWQPTDSGWEHFS